MLLDSSYNRRLTFGALVIALALIGGLRGLGVTTRLNTGFYDEMMRTAPARESSSVLLLNRANLVQPDQRHELLNRAASAGVLGVVWLDPLDAPQNIPIPIWPAARVAVEGNIEPGRVQLVWEGQSSEWAWCRFDMQHGVHRQAALRQIVEESERVCVQTAVAESLRKRLPSNQFLIDFSGGASHIPQLSWTQALQGDWLGSLGQNRVLLVAPADGRGPNLATPLDDRFGITEAELQAFVLDTLLMERAIEAPSAGTLWLIVAATLMLSALIMQLLPTVTAGALTAGLMLTTILACWVALHQWHFWLPVSEIQLALLAGFVVTSQSRRVAEEAEVGRLQRNLTGIVARQVPAATFVDSEHPWDDTLLFLTQHLNLTRTILLELPVGAHHLAVIVSHGCAIDDLSEKRRDRRRSPYREALAQNGPTKIARRFLKRQDPNHEEYMIPLTFAGELLGFWYACIDLGIDSSKRPSMHDLHLFAAHTAALLARSRADRKSYHSPAMALAAGCLAPPLSSAGECGKID